MSIIASTRSDSGLQGDELKKFFTLEVTENMRRLWTIIDEEDYATREQQDALLFEITQYITALQETLYESRSDQIIAWVLNCFGLFKLEQDNLSSRKVMQNFSMPYEERKYFSAQFRALLWQIVLELSNFVTDVILLFTTLLVEEFDLFLISAIFISISILARIFSAIRLSRFVDGKKFPLYLLGFLINIFETNAGLFLMKHSFRYQDKEGLRSLDRFKEAFVDDFFTKAEKDHISVNSKNAIEAGYSELFNIFAVTVIEDIPQLIVELVYLARQDVQAVDLLFYFALATTVLHIALEWMEALITMIALFSFLPSIDNGREINIDNSSHNDKIQQNRCFQQRRIKPDPFSLIEKYHKTIRKVNFAEYNDSREILRSLNNNRAITLVLKVPGSMLPQDFDFLSRSNFKYLVEFSIGVSATVHNDIPVVAGHDEIVMLARSCRRLERLEIAGASITEPTLQELMSTCKYLKHVDFSDTSLNQPGLIEFAKFYGDQLRTVKVEGVEVGDMFVKAVAEKCRKVRTFYLSGMEVSHIGWRELAENCTSIEEFSSFGVSDDALIALGQGCSEIRKLYLHESHVDKTGYEALAAGCKKLEAIYLKNTDLDEGGLNALAAANRGLKALEISNTHVTSKALSRLPRTCKSIRSLFLNNTAADDSTLAALSRNCRSLNRLLLKGTKVSYKGLRVLAKGCHFITYINLQNNEAITDPGIEALASGCRKLQFIFLSRTSITDGALYALSHYCRNITGIRVDNTSVTILGVERLMKRCRYLERVDIPKAISEEEAAGLQRQYSNVSQVYRY